MHRSSEITVAVMDRVEALYVQSHQRMILYEIGSSLVRLDFTENDFYGAPVRLHNDGIVELMTANRLQSIGTAML